MTLGRGELARIRMCSRTPTLHPVEAAARGPLGGDGAGVPHPDSPAARHMADTSGVSASLAGRKLSQCMDDIARVTDWDALKAVAQVFLGPRCFSLGVCVGVVENPVMGALGVLELGKTFVLADVYDTLYGTRSWTSHLTTNPGGMLAKLGGLALVKLGMLKADELKQAHEAREAMLRELGQVFANPIEFLGNMAGGIKDEYAAKWQRFNVLYADPDLGSQFEEASRPTHSRHEPTREPVDPLWPKARPATTGSDLRDLQEAALTTPAMCPLILDCQAPPTRSDAGAPSSFVSRSAVSIRSSKRSTVLGRWQRRRRNRAARGRNTPTSSGKNSSKE